MRPLGRLLDWEVAGQRGGRPVRGPVAARMPPGGPGGKLVRMSATFHYVQPSWAERQLVNRFARLLVGRLGRSADNVQLLAVSGRTSGRIQLTPVKVLHLDARRYLVSRQGQAHWARNLRAAPEAELRVGSRREPVRAVAVGCEEAAQVLREYVRQASLKSTASLLGVGSAGAPDADFLHSAADHPVFRLEPR